jgi:YD repeat-containing protein
MDAVRRGPLESVGPTSRMAIRKRLTKLAGYVATSTRHFPYTEAPSSSSHPPAGLVESITDPLGNVTVYVYNANGNPTSITYADGTADEATEDFHYGALGLVDYHDDELNRRTYLSYDPDTRPRPDCLAHRNRTWSCCSMDPLS